ncbi:MAG: tRNA (adenosine(37)-N6)-threonylcarbamoyltransferase complex ATPase subunit type 1 TsaE [bacterium]|nr:tRNA (adenosine(37)-N6)-threonylcarbamoyltransferase complex ATPase subunit type 1 TsaE [bacterium]
MKGIPNFFRSTDSHSLEETERIAVSFMEQLLPYCKERQGACVVGLIGDLGSGKTAFVQAVAKSLSVRERVGSPTYVIMKPYELTGIFSTLWHIDCYRTEGREDLLRLGFERMIKDPQNIIFIEWADMIKDILPPSAILLSFSSMQENTRRISQL